MRFLKIGIRSVMACVGIFLMACTQNTIAQNKCTLPSTTTIYSNAFIHEETGDLLGYELTLQRHNNSKVDALLYVYEGAEDDEGIHLTGQISQGNLTVQGNWTEHLVEYPSKKEIIQTHFVKIQGLLQPRSLKGKITILDLKGEPIILNRVKALWFCKK